MQSRYRFAHFELLGTERQLLVDGHDEAIEAPADQGDLRSVQVSGVERNATVAFDTGTPTVIKLRDPGARKLRTFTRQFTPRSCPPVAEAIAGA
jgi:hypothetical protein